jgi:hypothetical protein
VRAHQAGQRCRVGAIAQSGDLAWADLKVNQVFEELATEALLDLFADRFGRGCPPLLEPALAAAAQAGLLWRAG